jgi:hypothetical protein
MYSSIIFIASMLSTLLTASPVPQASNIAQRHAFNKFVQERSLEKREAVDTTQYSFLQFAAGNFATQATSKHLFTLDNGVSFGFLDKDATFYVFEETSRDVLFSLGWSNLPGDCVKNNCTLSFTQTGNLGMYYNGDLHWDTKTDGEGAWLFFLDESPYIAILDAQENILWTTDNATSTI